MAILAHLLRKEVIKGGIYNLEGSDLESIWHIDGQELPITEKRRMVKNFASQFGFAVMVDFNLSRAVFIISN